MKPTILVVEDTDDCRETLEMSLSRISGVFVRAVATAEEALAHTASEWICALVTDLGLPEMSGFELIQHVRTQSHFASIPVLVVSGETCEHTRAKVAALGADAFISKPFSPAQVRNELQRLLQKEKGPVAGALVRR